MTYRLLDVDKEWPLVAHEFQSRGVPMPTPLFAMIMGCFDDDGLFTGSFIVIRMQVHLQPVVVYDPHALPGLIHAAEKEIESKLGEGVEYFCFADGRNAKIAEAFGAEQLLLTVFRKSIS